ncbi:MAG TPA: hypothetical protein VF730_10665 [Terracidiphilus sp.]
MVRKEVEELRKMGPLPSEKESIESPSLVLERYQRLLLSIERPVTDEEAPILAGLFGVDECFEMAWTLTHLIETAPTWSAEEYFENPENEWVQLLKDREKRWREAGYPPRSFYEKRGLPDPRANQDSKGAETRH